MNPLNAYLAQSVLQERYARAEAHNRARRERSEARPRLRRGHHPAGHA